MKTINDIMKTMTANEIAEHQDLIQECLDREKMNNVNSNNTQKNIEKISEICDGINWDFNNASVTINEIKEAIDNMNLSLKKTDGGIH